MWSFSLLSLCTHTHLRNPDPSIEELIHAGKEYFDQTYGETAKQTDALIRAIYPDLGTSFRRPLVHVAH